MTNERWQRVDVLYHAALERPATERAAFLDTACEGDDALRREVDSLLASDDEAQSFLAESAMGVAARALAESPTPSRIGQRLGSYELLAPLGAGGMGEVYRARDVRLDRIVAIKILASHVADDPEFRRRLAREARTISQLSHPHICTLYDVGQESPSAGTGPGVDYLVLEHLEGETLAERLARGALPLSTALRIAVEIASALDTAHRAGIVHRDLKPGNVFLVRGPSNTITAKLLDFGLAKAATILSGEPLASDRTAEGTILGTLPYMAPEQLEGKEADARTDIFGFGAVIYEAIAGRRAFDGGSKANVIAAILDHDPPPLADVQPATPAFLERIVKTCLAKNPDDRWQTTRDLLRELVWVQDGVATQPLPAIGAQRNLRRALLWAAATVIASLAGAAIYSSRPTPPAAAARISFSIDPPEGGTFPFGGAGMAVSPDGSRLAFVVAGGGAARIWVRRFDSVQPRALRGTEGASYPFWSPDGQSIGFFAQGKVKRIAEAGGEALTLCEVPAFVGIPGGGAWNQEGTIIFSGLGPIRRVPDSGGVPTAVTTIDAARKEFEHSWPVFLPDGRRFLFVARSTDRAQTGIYQGSLDSTETRRVLAAESRPVLLGSYLIVLSNRSLVAQAYDPDRAQIVGEPVVVADQIESDSPLRSGGPYAAANNALVYRSANMDSRLVWFDRAGNQIASVGAPGDYTHPALSSDDTRLAIEKTDPATGQHTIWVLDLSRGGVTSRLVFDAAGAHDPVWSPDGSRVVFGSNRLGALDLFSIRADGGGEETVVLSSGDKAALTATDWSLDGRFLLFENRRQGDLWTLPVPFATNGEPFLQTAATENQGQFSPDVRWVAYTSNESGSNQVYVRRFPGADRKWQVSTDGGTRPRWRRDGRELFYLAPGGRLMAVTVTANRDTFATAPPHALFIARGQYVVSGDGQRFLVSISPEDRGSAPMTAVLNWQAIVEQASRR